MKKIYSIVIFFIFIFILILATESCGGFLPDGKCSYAEEYRNDAFCAVVQRKYIDMKNHRQYRVDFDKPEAWLFLFGEDAVSEEGKIWNYIKVGDTIRKIKGTNTYIFKRSGARDTLFRLYYGCPDTTVLWGVK
jgi:hypothetical protein